LMFDKEIVSNTDGELPKTAQLRRLLCGKDGYSGEFDERASTTENIEDSETPSSTPKTSEVKIEPLTSRELKCAVKRASEFVRKFTPSALDAEVPAEVRTRSRLDNLATL